MYQLYCKNISFTLKQNCWTFTFSKAAIMLIFWSRTILLILPGRTKTIPISSPGFRVLSFLGARQVPRSSIIFFSTNSHSFCCFQVDCQISSSPSLHQYYLDFSEQNFKMKKFINLIFHLFHIIYYKNNCWKFSCADVNSTTTEESILF